MNPADRIEGKDEFIRRIASRLGRSEPLGEAPVRDVRGVPEFYRRTEAGRQELIERFVEEWTALSGKSALIPRAEAKTALADYAAEIVTGRKVRAAAMWDDPELADLLPGSVLEEFGVSVVPWRETADGGVPTGGESRVEGAAEGAGGRVGSSSVAVENQAGGGSKWTRRSALLRETERCELGIVSPDFAIANTGTLVLQTYGGRGRSVSLLPSILLAVFPAERLVFRMGEAFERLGMREDGPARTLPSSITLITGPSRSADIENDLTIGVHGPGQVHAVILV